jgi:hypothetical protein
LILNTDEYKVQVLTLRGDDWAGNNLRFTDYCEALNSVLGLAKRWLMVQHVRVVAA